MAAPYPDLLDHVRTTHLLSGAAGALGWDQEVYMPRGGAEQRARQLGLLSRLAHERFVDPQMGEWLDACGDDPELVANPEVAANLRELRREYDRARRLDPKFVARLTELESRAQHLWAETRTKADFDRFEPALTELVAMQRDKATRLSEPDHGEPWDALAEGYEPGMRARDLEPLFEELTPRLAEWVARIRDVDSGPSDRFLRLKLPIEQQEAFVTRVARALGFDFERGRLDRSAHPFTSGSHPGDVRITTRYAEDNLPDALGSTVHEVGHGLYEQGLPAEHAGTPLGTAVSLGIHESQSRLWENQVMRSHGFWRWAQPILRETFGAAVDDFSVDDLHRAVNRVEPGFIRVEADEVTYNLHVALRFRIERRLINGDLEVADLPDAWNSEMQELLGLAVPDVAVGCMQDVHWAAGLFGYFPTYTLGNLYSAQLYDKAQEELGNLDESFARGEFEPLLGWLRANIHAYGSRYSQQELCERATGAPLTSSHLLTHLSDRIGQIYAV